MSVEESTYMNIKLDFSKLLPMEDIKTYLNLHGPTDNIFYRLRELYEKQFGKDLVWRYPFTDGCYMGAVIIPVREGFLSIPYDDYDSKEYEIYVPDSASLVDIQTLDNMCKDITTYAEGFCKAMQEAKDLILHNYPHMPTK